MRGGLVRGSMSLRMYFEASKAMCYPQFILLASFFVAGLTCSQLPDACHLLHSTIMGCNPLKL